MIAGSRWRTWHGRGVVGWRALVAVAVSCAVAAAGAPARAASPEELERRMEELQRELSELKEQLKAIRPPATAPPVAAPSGPASSAPAPLAPASSAAPVEAQPAAPPPASLLDAVKIGGYGSVRFESNTLDRGHDTFTFRRFILTTDARIAEPLRFGFELELERFTNLEVERSFQATSAGASSVDAIEGSSGTEISLEQAWLEYELEPWLRYRVGMLLVPVGRFNLNHDDNRWNLPRRSLVDRGVPVLPVQAA